MDYLIRKVKTGDEIDLAYILEVDKKPHCIA